MSPYSPVTHILRSATLAGRSSELLVLDQHIARTVRGTGSVLLISGEAGVGKSRFITEGRQRFLAQSDTNGVVLQTSCFELEQDYPYAPISDLLHRLRFNPPESFPADHLRRLPAIDAWTNHAPEPSADKRRVAAAFGQFMLGLARDHPTLLIIEDLHWADEATLDLLIHASRIASDHPLLYLFSYRSDEVGELLRRMLAILDRERRGAELALPPLDRFEVDTMLRDMFNQPQPIRSDFLDLIQGLTDGNPFFIEEVVSSLIAKGDVYQLDGHWERKETRELQVPRSVQDAVWRRAREMSADARQVLAIAAVSGRHFSFRVIQHLTGFTEELLLSYMRELIDQYLVYEDSDDRFVFRHALTREAIYTALLIREQRRLHRAIAEAIEYLKDERDEQHLADLAYHYDRAQAWDKSFLYAVRAGDRSLALSAPRAAVEHYTRALRAMEYLSLPSSPEIYRKRGQAYVTLGQFDLAHADFDRVRDIAQQRGDRQLEWHTLLDLGNLWTGRDYKHSGSFFMRALDLAQEMGDQTRIARGLLQVGNWQVNVEQVAAAEASFQAALDVFNEHEDQPGRAEALDLLGVVADASGDLSGMKHYYGAAARLYEALGNQKGVVSTLANTATLGGAYSTLETISLHGGVPVSEAEATGQRMVDLAREIDWRSGECYALVTLGWHYAAHGRYDLALDLGRKSLELTREIEHHEWMSAAHMVTGTIYAGLLDHRQAVSEFSQGASAASTSGSVWLQRLMSGHLAAGAIDAGDLALAEEVLAGRPDDLPMNTMGSRRLWIARAKLYLATGQPAAALEIGDQLFATAANFTAPSDIPGLACFRSACLIALGQHANAEAWLRTAHTGAITFSLKPLLWRVLVTMSQLYRLIDHHAEAEQSLSEARAVIESIAGSMSDEAIRQMFVSNISALLPPQTTERVKRDLTPREKDVARLVAQEMTNREIAEALFIGERTVETHVANILAKNGFTSRRQIVTWMNEAAHQGDTTR